MKNSSMMTGIYVLSEWVMRFSVINLLWLSFNLPIVFIVWSILFIEDFANLFLLLVPLIVLMPILFFPATAAMFASARGWILKKEDQGLIKTYWYYYKENYRQSFIGGILLTILWLIWAVDYYYFSRENIVLMFAFFMMGTILFVFTINFFSVIAHFDTKLRTIIKNTLFMTIGSPVLFISVLLGNGIILLMSFHQLPILIPFFTWSMLAFLSFSAFYRCYLKITNHSN